MYNRKAMDPFSPERFFSLERFAHNEMWKENLPVWSAIDALLPYLESCRLGKIESKIPEGVYLENREQISIGPNVIFEPGAFLQGPCIIGAGSEIRHGAYLRGGVILGEGCVVGHAAEIKHAILLDGAHATHFVYAGDSILGNKVNLGAGVKCANLRLDRKEVSILFEGAKVRTGLRKFGAIVGDGAQIGCNAVLNPGTILGRNALCYPLVHASGVIPEGGIVKKAGVVKGHALLERMLETR